MLKQLPLNQVVYGDCIEVLKEFPDNCIDEAVTDPPYGIGFMGKDWDQALPPKEAFEQIFRVLKPGALAFIMSSPRQDVLWRMMALLEGCGFQLRQSFVSWIYKSGFPKAYDLSLGIDKKFIRQEFIAEHERKPTKDELKALLKEKRKVIGKNPNYRSGRISRLTYERANQENQSVESPYLTEPYHSLAKEWVGYKGITGLKPALECILMVNKPMSERTIVDNVLKHGVGAVNVDACRIPFQNEQDVKNSKIGFKDFLNPKNGWNPHSLDRTEYNPSKGRFPANLLVSDGALDNGKITKYSVTKGVSSGKSKFFKETKHEEFKTGYTDEGGQSRFFDLDAWAKHHGFLDVAKASKAEREMGLIGQEKMQNITSINKPKFREQRGRKAQNLPRKNFHPTVKPVKLMAYLIELGCPKDGVVIDPFCGSGSTLIAAHRLNRKWIGIEIDKEYVKIANARLATFPPRLDDFLLF